MRRLVASPGGRYLAVVEAGRVIVGEPATKRIVLELALSGGAGAGDVDVAFIGDRMLALVHATSKLHVIELSTATSLAELPVRGRARLTAITARLALVTAPGLTATIACDSTRLVPLPVRADITAAAKFGDTTFVLATAGSTAGAIDEWDATTRGPSRRARHDRRIVPMFIGGSGQRIWFVPRDTPDVLEIISLESKTSRRIELPRAVRSVDACGDQLAMIGVDDTPFVVDLASAEPVRMGPVATVDDLVWLGAGALACVTRDARVTFHRYSLRVKKADTETIESVEDPSVVQVAAPEPDLRDRLRAWRERAAAA